MASYKGVEITEENGFYILPKATKYLTSEHTSAIGVNKDGHYIGSICDCGHLSSFDDYGGWYYMNQKGETICPICMRNLVLKNRIDLNGKTNGNIGKEIGYSAFRD